jgi:signal transduction histidine kinase
VPVLAAQLTQLPGAAADVAAGLALLGGGALARARGARTASASLMALTGAAWFAGEASSALLYAHRGPLVHLLLSYPAGRVRSRGVVAVIAAAYVDGLIPALARSVWPTLALATAVLLAAAWRYRAAGGVERRARAVALAGALMIGGALAFAAAGRLSGADADTGALWAYYVAVTVTAFGLTADLLWGRWTRAAVTGLVIDLGARHEPQALRAALARALGDPGLQVAYRAGGGWVDETGGLVELPKGDGAGRGVTLVHEAGEAVAALIHDRAALADAELAASVAAAARLAVANAGMQAEIAARVREVDSSRRRLVEAGDDARRRLGDELHAGVERQLSAISERFAALAGTRDGDAAAVALGRLSAELDDAREDLRRFGQGIHPRALTEAGLGAALGELAIGAPMPVTVAATQRRFPSTHEAAAYFVCSEALANVAKHAGAARVDIAVAATADRLVVSVVDSGAGGADAALGSGLRGLADRLEALGGTLRVDSPAGAGTRLEAALPI